MPEDGYYMFTLVVREDGNSYAAGTIQRISATDPNDVTMLCAAEEGDYSNQTGSCTVRTFIVCMNLSEDSAYASSMSKGF